MLVTHEEIEQETARQIKLDLGLGPDGPGLAVVLGSGWGAALEEVASNNKRISYADIPGMSSTSVAGHAGFLGVAEIHGVSVLYFAGRSHYYESRNAAASTKHIRLARHAGARGVILTNGAGSTSSLATPGDVVVIADHINMTGDSPLSGPLFVSMTDAYDRHWREMLMRTCAWVKQEGVYVQMPGPQYETPAEVRAMRAIGADLVGMSTALETIEARGLNMKVLGLSLVTNYGAGVKGSSPSHAEVIETGSRSKEALGAVLAGSVESFRVTAD